jgi:hypothetical protein
MLIVFFFLFINTVKAKSREFSVGGNSVTMEGGGAQWLQNLKAT